MVNYTNDSILESIIIEKEIDDESKHKIVVYLYPKGCKGHKILTLDKSKGYTEESELEPHSQYIDKSKLVFHSTT